MGGAYSPFPRSTNIRCGTARLGFFDVISCLRKRAPCLFTRSCPSERKYRISSRSKSARHFVSCWPGRETKRAARIIRLPLFAFFKCSIRGRFLSCWRTRALMPFVAWPTYSASKFLPKRRKRIHRKFQGALPSQPYKLKRPGFSCVRPTSY